MKITLYYTFENEEWNGHKIDTQDYEYVLDTDLQDVLEYEYEKKFEVKYSPLDWTLEPGAKDFVKELEARWYKNEIDEVALYYDVDFINWLKNKYYVRALDRLTLSIIDEIVDAEMSYYEYYCAEHNIKIGKR